MTESHVSLSAGVTLASISGNRYSVRMLVGDGTYNGELYPAEDIAAAAQSMIGRPVNVGHSDDPADIVGVVLSAAWNPATKALEGEIELNPSAPRYASLKPVIDGTLAAGAVPNVSIEADAPRTRERIDGVERSVRRIARFVGLAVVKVGACDDTAGCGIVSRLARSSTPMPDETNPDKVALCAKDAALAAVTAERDDLATKLTKQTEENVALAARAEKAESELAAIKLEAERAPLVAELARVAPGFDAKPLGVPELRAALALAQSVKLAPPAAGRRTALAAAPTDAKDASVAALRAKMGLPAKK